MWAWHGNDSVGIWHGNEAGNSVGNGMKLGIVWAWHGNKARDNYSVGMAWKRSRLGIVWEYGNEVGIVARRRGLGE